MGSENRDKFLIIVLFLRHIVVDFSYFPKIRENSMEEVFAFPTKYAYEQYVQSMGISIRAKVCMLVSSALWAMGYKIEILFLK